MYYTMSMQVREGFCSVPSCFNSYSLIKVIVDIVYESAYIVNSDLFVLYHDLFLQKVSNNSATPGKDTIEINNIAVIKV